MSAQLHTGQTGGTTLVPPNEHGQSSGHLRSGNHHPRRAGGHHSGAERRGSGHQDQERTQGTGLRLVRPDDADAVLTRVSDGGFLMSEVPGTVTLLPEARHPGPVELLPTDRAERRLEVRRKRSRARTLRRMPGALLDREAGMATAEYAIATLAAVGFAALLVAVLSSGEVRGLLMSLITSALNFG